MKKSLFMMMLAGVFACTGLVEAALKAELIMPGGRSWKGSVVSRDGNWIEFSTGGRPIRIGANTIDELVFEVRIDADKMNEMNRNREYTRLIATLTKVLDPYKDYNDIRSNLVRYNSLLMELYYKTGEYDKATAIASQIVADDRDEKLQDKSRIYHALSLIDAGRAAEAEALLAEYGWDGELDADAAPEKLYVTAKLLAMKKDYSAAMELVAKVIAFNSQDPDWMQPAELLCAEVYTELGMYDSAEEVIHQISLLYKDTNEDDLALKLKIRIEGLRAEQALEQSEEL
jgi:tetratricopeptide (TPR) repeat protein